MSENLPTVQDFLAETLKQLGFDPHTVVSFSANNQERLLTVVTREEPKRPEWFFTLTHHRIPIDLPFVPGMGQGGDANGED